VESPQQNNQPKPSQWSAAGEMCGIKLAAIQIDQRLPKDQTVTVEFTPIGSEHSVSVFSLLRNGHLFAE
jgi:hypothetical protein